MAAFPFFVFLTVPFGGRYKHHQKVFIPLLEGNSLSREKQTYSIIKRKEKSKYIIVNVLKDKLLIAPVNLETKTITPEYTLIEQKTDYKPQDKKDGSR